MPSAFAPAEEISLLGWRQSVGQRDDFHHHIKVMVRAKIEGCLILAITPVDYDTSGNTQPCSNIEPPLKIMQTKGVDSVTSIQASQPSHKRAQRQDMKSG